MRVVEQKGQILTFEDQDYPEQLREIFDPPPVLWVLGDVKLLGSKITDEPSLTNGATPRPYLKLFSRIWMKRDLYVETFKATHGRATQML